jgi:hypothetical protein
MEHYGIKELPAGDAAETQLRCSLPRQSSLRIHTLATAHTPHQVLSVTASATAVGHTAIVAKEN